MTRQPWTINVFQVPIGGWQFSVWTPWGMTCGNAASEDEAWSKARELVANSAVPPRGIAYFELGQDAHPTEEQAETEGGGS